MGILFPDPPPPPNPILTGALQTATNVGTAVTNSYMNNYNQVTPGGNLTYDVTGNYGLYDPASGITHNVPRWTATQTGPEPTSPYYDQYQASIATGNNLAQAGTRSSEELLRLMQQSGRPDYIGTANTYIPGGQITDLWGAPMAQTGFADAGQLQRSLGDTGSQQTGFGDAGSQQYSFGDAGDITRSYGPADNYSADRARVEESLYGRLQPQLQKDRANLEQRLADQGIRYGSEAYNAAMDDYNRQSSDARLAVTAQGGQEQQRMNDMAAQRAGFQNAAQQQAYQQAMGRGTFANAAQMATFEQAKARGMFANEAQAQEFLQSQQEGNFVNQAQKDAFSQAALRGEYYNAAAAQQLARHKDVWNAMEANRARYLAENYADRNQRINEITALQSGSQVAPPQFQPGGSSQIPTTDYAGLINNRFSQDMNVYQQQNQNINQLVGGIFGAAGKIGAGYAQSDRRTKENIDKVGTIFAAGPDGEKPLPIYEYDYKRDDPDGRRHVGPMAQDVEKIDRRAVKTRGGVKYIDMTRMGSILKAA